ncbi:MAG: hypothetical protein H7222_04230 [Methylotenera sp.]|nr:hypothetical protein [Oligoflexia bacterium]
MTEAREFRKGGYRGAAFFEILGLVARRRKAEMDLAWAASKQIRSQDLYSNVPLALPLDSEALIGICSWILRHEWTPDTESFNPALRVQELLSLNGRVAKMTLSELSAEGAAESATHAAMLSERALELGEAKIAFKYLVAGLARQDGASIATRAAVQLFRSVPHEDRTDTLKWDGKGKVRSFGVAPIRGAGFIAAEYLGVAFDGRDLLAPDVPGLPEVEVYAVVPGGPNHEQVIRLMTEWMMNLKIKLEAA